MKPIHHPFHQIFTAQPQAHLFSATFTPNLDELSFAKHSLAEKKKALSSVQQILLCKKNTNFGIQTMTVAEKQTLEQEKKKYLDFVKSNFKFKYLQETSSFSKFRNSIQNRIRDDQKKEKVETTQNKSLQNHKRDKKISQSKPKLGSKKIKQENGATNSKKKGKEQKIEKEVSERLDENSGGESSMIDLMNDEIDPEEEENIFDQDEN